MKLNKLNRKMQITLFLFLATLSFQVLFGTTAWADISNFDPLYTADAAVSRLDEIYDKIDPLYRESATDHCNRISAPSSEIHQPCLLTPVVQEHRIYRFIHGIMSWLNPRSLPVPMSEGENECILLQVLSKIQNEVTTGALAQYPLERYVQLRGFLFDFRKYLENSKNKRLRTKYLAQVNSLIAEVNPYESNPSSMVNKLVSIYLSPNQLTDVRDISLVTNFLLDPKVQNEVNRFVRTQLFESQFKKVPGTALSKGKAKRFLENFSYLGIRIKNLPKVRNSVRHKLQTGIIPNNSAYTVDELWLLDHEDLQSEGLNTLLSKIAPTAVKDLHKTFRDYSTLMGHKNTLTQNLSQPWESGDFVLQSISKKMSYQGKKRDRALWSQKFFTRSDTYHAAIAVKSISNGNKLFHSLDEGIGLEDMNLGDFHMAKGYRILLDKIMDPQFRAFFEAQARREGRTLEEFLRIKKRQYNEDYTKSISDDYSFETSRAPKYLITNRASARNSSITNIRNWFPEFRKKDLKSKVIQARNGALNPKYSEYHQTELARVEQTIRELQASKQQDVERLDRTRHEFDVLNSKVDRDEDEQDQLDDLEVGIEAISNRLQAKDRELVQPMLQAENLRQKLQLIQDQLIQNAKDPQWKSGQSQVEICSEFALKEWTRYIMFIEEKLSKEFSEQLRQQGLNPKSDIFTIPFGNRTRFSGFHTGSLERLLEGLEKKGMAVRVGTSAAI